MLPRSTPVQVGAATDWAGVALGYQHSYARKTNGTVHCWGENSLGSLGDGTFDSRLTPVQVGVATDWAELSLGGSFHTWEHHGREEARERQEQRQDAEERLHQGAADGRLHSFRCKRR